jgi:hypothetical protein
VGGDQDLLEEEQITEDEPDQHGKAESRPDQWALAQPGRCSAPQSAVSVRHRSTLAAPGFAARRSQRAAD